MLVKRLNLLSSLLLLIVSSWLTQPVFATDVAIIEDLDSRRTDLGLFEILQEGKEIQLQPMEVIIIGYLHSCNREIVTGGVVRIGTSMSTVEEGAIIREKVPCTGDQIVLDDSTADQAGVVVFRSATKKSEETITAPPQLLDVSPTIRIKQSDQTVLLKRIDKMEAPRLFKAENYFVDFREYQVVLVRGGSYELRAGKDLIQFNISPNARENTTLLERLVIL